jgi:hypothetical protein
MRFCTRPEANAERLLQRLLAADPRDETFLVKRCATVADWSSLADRAEWHGVLGLLHRALSASTYGLPGEAGDAIRRRAVVQRLAQRCYDEVLNEILAALHDAGVETVALKGPILGERLYGEPTLRVSSDLDLMVARSQVVAATDVLSGLGYQVEPTPAAHERWGHHIKAHRDGSPLVELHHRLTTNFGAVVPSEEFLARAAAYRTVRGAACRVLSTEDELFYLVLHAAEHLFARLAWLYDIKTLLAAHPDIDGEVVAGRAREYGVERPYAFAIDLIARRMEIALPASMIRPGISRIRALAAAALLAAAERSPSSVLASLLGHLFRATLVDRPTAGVHYLWRQFQRVRRRRRHDRDRRHGGVESVSRKPVSASAGEPSLPSPSSRTSTHA